MADLTKKQRVVLEAIAKAIDEKGYVPAVREICASIGLSSPSTVQVHLNSLEERGFIHRDAQKSRSITLTAKGREELGLSEDPQPVAQPDDYNLITLPLVGQVAAGVPILAEENIEDTITLPVDIVGDSASFLLSVHGESMIEAGINDGDYLVVKEQSVANNGDIVVALVDDGATVKRFFREADHIRLQPENSSMEPIITRDCAIVGKVVALFRRVY
ncbi:MAG: transcriptional repressor LexA [Coriobacteriaceae bacterium]|nr:transcriptional repressor LexA [Coriobacteriaceae bacterium]